MFRIFCFFVVILFKLNDKCYLTVNIDNDNNYNKRIMITKRYAAQKCFFFEFSQYLPVKRHRVFLPVVLEVQFGRCIRSSCAIIVVFLSIYLTPTFSSSRRPLCQSCLDQIARVVQTVWILGRYHARSSYPFLSSLRLSYHPFSRLLDRPSIYPLDAWGLKCLKVRMYF